LAQYYSLSWDCYSSRIPEIILDSDDIVKRRLLRGYFDAEGYLKRRPRCVEAVSVNKKD
jgi:intein/homing endonuclease